MPKKKWTNKKLADEAKKYTTRSDFKNSSPSAYVIARKIGLLDQICSHMPRPKINKKNYWTEERILNEAKKYSTKKEFNQKCSAAYSAAGKLKIRDKACAHMNSNLWTKEKILKEILKYSSYTEFQKKSASAYYASIRLSLTDEIKKILKPQRQKNNYWTYKRLLEVAKKYSSKSEFEKSNRAAYSAARKHDRYSEIVKHMPNRKKTKKIKWDEESIRKLAKSLTNRTEFTKKFSAAAKMAKKLGIYDEITSHMEYKVKPNGTWTEKMVLKAAKNYTTRGDFQKYAHDAYLAARRLKIVEKACKHMKRVGNRYKRAIYAFEFKDKSVYVGLTYNYDKRYNAHMKGTKVIIDKTKEMGHEFIMFNEFYDAETAAKKEAELIEEYQSKGWKILNKAKAGALGSNIRKWTVKEILKEAKKYNSISEFNNSNSSAYNAALKLGLKERIKEHMTNLRKPAGYWTKKRVLNEAKKYQKRSDFHKYSPSAFIYAKKLGIREECYEHMKAPERSRKWHKEKIKEEALLYKTRGEFRKNSSGAYKAALRLKILDEVCKHMLSPKKVPHS